MKQLTLALFGLLALALPQVARAQSFNGDHAYSAKFVCGYAPGGDTRLGLVEGHYNTIINIHAVEERTSFAFRATAMSTNLETETGIPSGFSIRFDVDRDGGIGIVCGYIKSMLGVQGQEGIVEGFVTIYSTRPLDVVDVISGEDGGPLSVLDVIQVPESGSKAKVDPQPAG